MTSATRTRWRPPPLSGPDRLAWIWLHMVLLGLVGLLVALLFMTTGGASCLYLGLALLDLFFVARTAGAPGPNRESNT